MEEQRLSGALQENILTVLCFDEQHCRIVRAAVQPRLFESSVFREVAGHAIDFIDQFGAPIADHLPDHLEGILKGDDARKAATYKRLLDNLFVAKGSVNAEYVISQLHKFVRQQTLKSAFVKAAEAFEDGNVELAEVELQKGLDSQSVAFEMGLNFSDVTRATDLLDDFQEEGFTLGIPDFDKRGIIPRRKSLFAFIAARGRGKSWFSVQCAKMAMLQRWPVVLITLEMSEKEYGARFVQSFFSIGRREGEIRVARLKTDRRGELEDILFEKLERDSLTDAKARTRISRRIKREFAQRAPLIIKSFPAGMLTVPMLRAYLDGLERFEGVQPGLVIVDMPVLMQNDANNLRVTLGQTTMMLRGIGQERNCAVVALYQGNRESESARLVTGAMAAEDISVLAHSDVVMTYSQTPAEYKLGMARLFAEKARTEHAKQTVLITQAYAVGQFVLDSTLLRDSEDYWEMLRGEQRGEEPRGKDDEKERQ